MRVALVFLAGMAFVAGFSKHARSLDERSMRAMPPTTAAEFAAYKQRWRANRLAAEQTPPIENRAQYPQLAIESNN